MFVVDVGLGTVGVAGGSEDSTTLEIARDCNQEELSKLRGEPAEGEGLGKFGTGGEREIGSGDVEYEEEREGEAEEPGLDCKF